MTSEKWGKIFYHIIVYYSSDADQNYMGSCKVVMHTADYGIFYFYILPLPDFAFFHYF